MDVPDKKITNRRLSAVNISDTSYCNYVFEGIQIDMANFRDCEFEKCRFINCSLKNLHFYFCKIIDCEFESCLLQGINASGIMFPCTFSLENCDLRFIDFIGLRLQKSKFLSTKFKDCLFEEADLCKSDFTGSEFTNTEFRFSDLSHCNFSMTDGLDINHDINKISSVKIPQEAGLKILNRMGVVISS